MMWRKLDLLGERQVTACNHVGLAADRLGRLWRSEPLWLGAGMYDTGQSLKRFAKAYQAVTHC